MISRKSCQPSAAILFLTGLIVAAGLPARASVMEYGDEDCLNQGCYGASDPKAGATLLGVAVNTISLATSSFGHSYPFSPSSDFPGTDQIYVGSVQTQSHDGYSVASQRINGPATFTLDYSSLVASGQTVTSITLGIAADDFQQPEYGNLFTASIDGAANSPISNELNALDLTGPQVQFFTAGLDPSIDTASHTITLTIDEGGDGGDGYAVDFLTVGVTVSRASATPEPASTLLAPAGILLIAALRRLISRRK